jgi:hypothetical protein
MGPITLKNPIEDFQKESEFLLWKLHLPTF